MSNYEEAVGHSVGFTASNETSVYDETNCPPGVLPAVRQAISRGQRVGVIFNGGTRWQWATVADSEQNIMLEFERGGELAERYEIPWQSWEAFKIVAAQNGRDSKDYLTMLLGCGMAEGETLGEMIWWLFSLPSKSDVIERFEAEQKAFHAEVSGAN